MSSNDNEQPPTFPAPNHSRKFAPLSWLSSWWDRGVWQKLIILACIPLLLACFCCSGSLIFAATPLGQQYAKEADATNTAQAIVDAQATATAYTYALAHPTPTARPTSTVSRTTSPVSTMTTIRTATPASEATSTPTPKPRATATVVKGDPSNTRVGAPEANFIAKFGQPISHGSGNSDNFYADSTQTIILGVTQSNTVVTQVSVLGDSSWTDQQTFNYCTQFLPSDAVKYNAAPPYTDYHTSLGQVVLANYGNGTCSVFVGGN